MSDTTPHFSHQDLLGLRPLSAEDISLVLNQAKAIKDLFSRPIKQVPTLRGKTLATLFFEPSTRTKASFDMAVKLLGAGTLNMSVESSSVKKGESLADTVKNLAAMGIDGIIIRHPNAGAPDFIAKILNIPVINAGDGFHEHPTQGLLDMFTMLEHCADLKNKKVLILGDILHSRVARSNIWGLSKLGAKVVVCGPTTLLPKGLEKMGVEVTYRLDEVLPEMDFINVLRVQFERQKAGYFPTIREYRELFCLTPERLARTKADTKILHPGPLNRGIEIDSIVADSPKSVILDQVTNGIAVRMAVLYLLLGRAPQ